MGTAAETMPSWRTIESVVASACRAPSLHNSQPWRWVLEPEGLTLSSDPDRILPATDSFGRQMVVSCGAALNHLKYALLEHHWDSVIERMPHSANRECLATVAFTPTAEVSESEISMQRRSHAGTPSGYRCLHLPHGTTPWRRSPNSPNAQEHTWKTSEIAHDPHSRQCHFASEVYAARTRCTKPSCAGGPGTHCIPTGFRRRRYQPRHRELSRSDESSLQALPRVTPATWRTVQRYSCSPPARTRG